MTAKRKPKPAPQLALVPKASQAQPAKRRSPWSDWTPNTTPFICTIGADLVESQRLANQLQQLRMACQEQTDNT